MFTFAHIIIIDISMTKSKHNKNNRKKIKIVSGIIVICALAICFFCFSSMSNNGKTRYVFIDHNDNIDSVYYKLEKVSTKHSFWTFKLLANLFSYKNHIRPGKYTIDNSGALMTFRNFRNGKQASISLTIRSVRTLGDLATDVSGKLMFSRKELMDSLTSETTCKKYGYTPKNIIAMFIPNTYDFYWNTSVSDFLEKIYKENEDLYEYAYIYIGEAVIKVLGGFWSIGKFKRDEAYGYPIILAWGEDNYNPRICPDIWLYYIRINELGKPLGDFIYTP